MCCHVCVIKKIWVIKISYGFEVFWFVPQTNKAIPVTLAFVQVATLFQQTWTIHPLVQSQPLCKYTQTLCLLSTILRLYSRASWFPGGRVILQDGQCPFTYRVVDPQVSQPSRDGQSYNLHPMSGVKYNEDSVIKLTDFIGVGPTDWLRQGLFVDLWSTRFRTCSLFLSC